MELRYFVPFKAQSGVNADFALRQKLVNIEGVAVDASVNANKWQVPSEDLDFVAQTLAGAQLRVDHADSALMVVGKVCEAKRDGDRVLFHAEVGEERLIEKIIRGYVTHVSIQVDSQDVECSKCHKPTRKEGMLVHLCPGAWEIIHKPSVRELSIVASPAYKDTVFSPVGFFAAMNKAQRDAMVKAFGDSELSSDNKDVGSKPWRLQEPENKQFAKKVEHMSEFTQNGASPHQQQGIGYIASEEMQPKLVTYEDFMVQLQQIEKQLSKATASETEIEALKQKIAALEAEVAKKAAKQSLSRKISELKQLEDDEDDAEPQDPKETSHASGRGIVAADYVAIQAETVCASLIQQPEGKPVTLEKLLAEGEDGVPISLGELFSRIANRLSLVGVEDTKNC